MEDNNLPIYIAKIEYSEDGISNISLVDEPATETPWIACRKEEEYLTFSVKDEEQHIITGVVMRADFPIYRGDCYVTYPKETIELMARKLLKDNLHNSINVMHMDDSHVDGVYLTQLFIKNSEKGICPKGFENIEEGSLFAEYKVENESIWQKIKDGTFRGFSLEGFFSFERKQDFSKMKKIKELIKNALQAMSSIETDKGTLLYDAEEIAVGVEVIFEDGKEAEDGEYITDDNVIVILDGKIAEIKQKEKEAVEEEKKEEEMAAEEEKVEEVVEEEPQQVEEVIEEDKTAELQAKISELEAIITDMQAKISELENKIDQIIATPVVTPIEDEMEVKNAKKSGNSPLDKICNALRN